MMHVAVVLWSIVEKLLYQILNKIFKLANKELSDEKFRSFIQFIKFSIVGLSNTLISYASYVCCLCFFKRFKLFLLTDYVLAQLIAFVLSVLWSFFWNDKIVFVQEDGQDRVWWKALIKTYVSYSFTGLFLSSILLVLWVRVFHISEFIGPILNLFISVPLNFIINKFWAFK